MLPGKVYRPEDILRILRKRAWLLVVPWAAVAAGTAVVARKLPDTYLSQATVQVVPPRVPDSIVRTQTGQNLQQRLQAIQQGILSRTKLERVIQDFNLYENERRSGAIMQDVVEQMMSDIHVVQAQGNAFYVQYEGRDRRKVQQVAEALAGFFIQESQRYGERSAENTSEFVESQVEQSLRKLKEVEDKVTKYKQEHAAELPEQLASNQNAVQSTLQQLGMIISSKEADTNTRLSLERQISDLEAGGDPGPVASGAVADGTAAQRLDTLRRELANLQARGYSPEHYDIKRLTAAIELAKKEAEAEALKSPVAAGGAVSPAEQLRRRRLADLQNQLEDVKKSIASKQQEEKRLRDVAVIYQARVDRASVRAAEMVNLTREYDVLTKNYQNMVSNREQAAASLNAEVHRISEQFNLLDPARVPERPYKPNRPLINIFGIIGGLGVGLALVGLLEYRDHTFKTDTELAGYVSLPVLAVVPLMKSGKEQKAAFRHRVLLHVGCGSAVLICVALLTYTFVR